MKLVKNYGKIPMSFETNHGQTNPQVKFLARSNNYTLFLTPNETVLKLQQYANPEKKPAVVRMKLDGANQHPEIMGVNKLPGKANYFTSKDSANYHTHIPTYEQVKYHAVYPGIDMIFYGNQQQLEYDFVLSPTADPDAINLNLEGIEKLEIDDAGHLILHTLDGKIRLRKPFVYQEKEGHKQKISGSYILKNEYQVGFEVGTYDSSRPLVIDPVLEYATYLGGSDDSFGQKIVVDDEGNTYITGRTNSTDFPTQDALQPTYAGGSNDAFITKINADGSALIYSTYLGGSGDDRGRAIAIDTVGNAYVTGRTNSLDFPLQNPLQPVYGGGDFDGFISKLNADGSALIYSTYFGGSGTGDVRGIAVDTTGNAYVSGRTNSLDFPVVNALQPTYGGDPFDGFVVKVNAAGSAFIFSTYLGGNDDDDASDIAIDEDNNIYVTGFTTSTNFPLANPLQSTLNGPQDIFISKIAADGSAFIYSTYLGGSNEDRGRDITVDTDGNAYITGDTNSLDFPVKDAVQSTYGGGSEDAFVTKINPDGSALIYSTYLGGSGEDRGRGIDVGPGNNAYVTGFTSSTDFPLVNPIQDTLKGTIDAFVTKISADGSMLIYSTYLGGSGAGDSRDITVDAEGTAYITGFTDSDDFPVTENAFQPEIAGGTDAFIAKITDAADLTLTKTDTPDPVIIENNSCTSACGGCLSRKCNKLTYIITVTNNGLDTATGVTVTDILPTEMKLISVTPTQGSCSISDNVITCDLGTLASSESATITIIVQPTKTGTFRNRATVTSNELQGNNSVEIVTTVQKSTRICYCQHC